MNEKCGRFETLISTSLDGELSPEEADACHAHLSVCADCRRLSERLEGARQVLRSTPEPEAPVGLLEAIRADAEREMEREDAVLTLWSRWRAPALAAVAAAAVLLAAVYLPRMHHVDEVAPVSPATEESAITVADPDRPEEVAVAPEEDEEAYVPSEPEIASVPEETQTAPTPPPTESSAREDVRVEAPHVSVPASVPEVVDEEPTAEPAEVADPSPPELAHASSEAPAARPKTEPVLADSSEMMIAEVPRTTLTGEDAAPLSGPSSLEMEIANSVVARMVVDHYINETMVEAPSTLLAVITDSPPSEFGPLLTEDFENGSFGASFTETIRRVLSETENGLP